MCRFQTSLNALILATALTALPGRSEPLVEGSAKLDHDLTKGRVLCKAGHFQEAKLMFDAALYELERLHAGPSLRAVVYDERGTIFKVTGQYHEAENDYLRAADLFEKDGGRKGMRLALVLSHLGAYYMEAGQFSRAESYLNQSRAMAEASPLADSSDYASVLQNLGVLRFQGKDYAEAERLLRAALGILRRDGEANRWRVAVVDGNLASVLAAQGHRQQALVTAQQAGATFRNSPGLFPSCFIQNLIVTAQIEHSLGRDVEAAQASEEALRVGEKVLGFDNPKLLPVLTTYSAVLSGLRRNREAKEMKKRSEQLQFEYASRTHAGDLVDVSAQVRDRN